MANIFKIPHRIINAHKIFREAPERNGRSSISLFIEWMRWRKSRQISLTEYSNYRLYKRDNPLRLDFLSYTKASYYWKVLNPDKYACLARDKYLAHLLLDQAKVPQPTLLAYYNPEISQNSGFSVKDYSSLVKLLKDKKVNTFVIKPAIDSSHGKGVVVCHQLIERCGELIITKFDGSEILLKNLIGNEPLLLENVVKQTQQMASFNASSINTVRIMTALYPDGEVKCFAAFIKIGREGADIDNAGSGGNVDCGVDIEDGTLYNANQFNSWDDVKAIDCHPDSSAKLNGEKIHNWHEIVEKVKSFQARLPYLKTIGWDVAITDNGPVIIEINNWWDTTGQLFIGKGWADKVLDCYNAWTHQ